MSICDRDLPGKSPGFDPAPAGPDGGLLELLMVF
jgi:hypothetical protein